MANNAEKCPRCGAESLKSWAQLNEEERLVVARLPAAAEYSESERRRHRWCPRCWYEAVDDEREA
jgi:ribosomal protein S27AE